MSWAGPLLAIAALCIATVSAGFLARIFGTSSPHGRFAVLDGPSEMQEFLVFAHQARNLYFQLRLGSGGSPTSISCTWCERASIRLFVMIQRLYRVHRAELHQLPDHRISSTAAGGLLVARGMFEQRFWGNPSMA